MDSSERGALMLVRIIALALIGWAVAEVALYMAVSHHNQQPVAIGKVLVKSLPIVVGAVVMIKARAIADWLADWLDL